MFKFVKVIIILLTFLGISQSVGAQDCDTLLKAIQYKLETANHCKDSNDCTLNKEVFSWNAPYCFWALVNKREDLTAVKGLKEQRKTCSESYNGPLCRLPSTPYSCIDHICKFK